jgi:hypothetical protein
MTVQLSPTEYKALMADVDKAFATLAKATKTLDSANLADELEDILAKVEHFQEELDDTVEAYRD